MSAHRRRRLAGTIAVAAGALALIPPAAAQQPSILHARVQNEVITPVIADFLRDGVARAAREGDGAFLVELDTPGGLDSSMRAIVQAFLATRVPVVVFVPPGGRAASAGAIIGMAAHVLAMAPASTIGAATPVDLQGGDISAKIINDAAAYSASIARERGRDEVFAREAVTKGRAITAAEAGRLGVARLAENREALLRALDGERVTVAGNVRVTLHTAGAALVPHEMGFFARARQRLADPNLAFLFLSIGTLAIIYELAAPGVGAGGIVGVILILLALFSLSVLPVNVVGALLLVLAAALFATEVFVPGIGVFAAGGVAALVLGGLLLFRGAVSVSVAWLVPTAAVVGGGVLLAARFAWRARRAPSATGAGRVVGRAVTVRTADGRSGQVFVEGAWWRVRSRGGPLSPGEVVRVLEADGLDLIVEPAGEPAEGGSS